MSLSGELSPAANRKGPKRQESRARVALEAKLDTLRGRSSGYLLNLSCHGAMVQMADPPRPGHEVILKCGPLDVLAEVAWTEHERCGLQFIEPIAESFVVALRRIADEAARQSAHYRMGSRPTLATRPLTPEEIKIAREWAVSNSWR
jgi:hypothetical protein